MFYCISVPDDLNSRVERLEEGERRAWAAIEALADKQERLDDVLVVLAEAQVETEKRFRETDARIDKLVSAVGEADARSRETDAQWRERFREADARSREADAQLRERFRETDAQLRERSREIDERIDKLVSAIGELIRARNGGTQK